MSDTDNPNPNPNPNPEPSTALDRTLKEQGRWMATPKSEDGRPDAIMPKGTSTAPQPTPVWPGDPCAVVGCPGTNEMICGGRPLCWSHYQRFCTLNPPKEEKAQ